MIEGADVPLIVANYRYFEVTSKGIVPLTADTYSARTASSAGGVVASTRTPTVTGMAVQTVSGDFGPSNDQSEVDEP
jgi:hypothetical protein